MSAAPDKEWWTAEELAEANLPDLPTTKRGVNMVSDRIGWRTDAERARKRSGAGGGWEYHWSLLPHRARKALLSKTAPKVDRPGSADAWKAFESLPDKPRAVAAERLAAIQSVEALAHSGTGKMLAVSEVAIMRGISEKTLWNWFTLIEGISVEDRLPYLAPRHRFAKRKVVERPDDSAFMALLKADYLRLEQPTFRQSYRVAVRLAEARRLNYVPPERTARRHFNTEVPRVTQVFAREGIAGLERCYPPQIRDRSKLVAMEGVNADCHKIDVFVLWEDGTIDRPQVVAFQDLYSGKILSWRVAHDPNKVAVMAAFGDMIDRYGIPKNCLFDNGREFANKWMTGGTATRFRFKVRDDDPLGVLPLLGIKVHWARPGHGQAKPIERAFRDLASDIAKDARFAGAYVGNRPDRKPENYGSKAVPVAEFLTVLEEGIHAHNARQGRLSHTALGRSFDETFDASYQTAPIAKATEEQRRLWLMGQANLKLHSKDSRAKLHGNYYFADWMMEFAGKQMVIRFDPEDLHSGIHIYDKTGAYQGYAPCQQAVGFFDIMEAKASARTRAQIRKAERQILEALRPVSGKEIADELRELTTPVPEASKATVVAPQFGERRDRMKLVGAPDFVPPKETAEAKVFRAEFAKRTEEAKASEPEVTRQDRFRRFLDIKAREDMGQPIGEAEARFALTYPQSAEYRALKKITDIHGLEALG